MVSLHTAPVPLVVESEISVRLPVRVPLSSYWREY